MTPATKDVVHAFLRAVSPFLATFPPLTRAPSSPTSKQPSRSPNLPQPVLPGGNSTAKVCHKTDDSDTFLPTANPSASKKVVKKGHYRLTPITSPPKPAKSRICLPKPAILCYFIKKLCT